MRTFLICVLFLVGCGEAKVIEPETCVVTENKEENTFTMSCPSGSSVTWRNGIDGVDADSAFQGDGTLYGSFEVKNSVDASILQYYSVIGGNLTISYSVSLPTITRVEGWTFISNDEVESVNMPALEYTNNMQIYNTNLTNLDNIGVEMTVNSFLIIINNQNLSQCHAQEWADSITVNGTKDISNNGPC